MKRYNIRDVEEFCEKNNFDFLSEKYIHCRVSYEWRCRKCGFVWNTAFCNILNYKRGCPRCSRKVTIVEDLIEELKNKNVLLKSKFTKIANKHKLKCLKCNFIWKASINSIRQGHGCPSCAGVKRPTIKDLHVLAKKRHLKLLSRKYINYETHLKWKCPNNHAFEASADSVKHGSGCPICRIYIKEEKCRFVFESLFKKKFPPTRKILGSNLQLDGYCQKLNLAFEYQGEQHYRQINYWHKNEKGFKKQVERDNRKTEICKKMNVLKIDIPYYVSKDNKELEKFIKDELLRIGYNFSSTIIDWKKFKGKKPKLRELKELIKNRKIKCLSKDYIDSITPLEFRCLACNHKWFARPANIKSGKGCPKCGGVLKKTTEEVLESIKDRSIKLLSPEYINCKTKLEWECLICGKSWPALPPSIISGNHGCPYCACKNRVASKKYTIEKIKKIISKKSIKMLSPEYKHIYYPMEWQCEVCGNVWTANFRRVKIGPGCAVCNKAKKKLSSIP